MINKLTVVGKLASEVKLDKVNGKYVANYTVTSSRLQKGKADLIPCVAWNKRAQAAARYLTKGDMVGLCGRLETEYEIDKRTGFKMLTFKLVIEDQQFLSNYQNDQSSFTYPQDEEKHYGE